MQIKRFEAKNMTEALRQIKRELGTEAVILSAKDMRKENRLLGISRKIGVEVTAAVDGALPQQAYATASPPAGPRGVTYDRRGPALPPTASGHLRSHVQDIVRLGEPERPPGRTGAAPAAEVAVRAPHQRGSASSVSHRAPGGGAPETGQTDLRPHLHKRLGDGGLEIMPWPFTAEGPHIIALVGNAGVGKTTTIAKLAARLQHEEGRQVGLISLDREKIGGIEQLLIYADILQIPLETPPTGQDLKKALKKLAACDVILVDTPAIGASKAKRPDVFDTQLRQIKGLQAWLVIGADNQVENMQLTAAMGDDLAISAVIVTKTDLSRRLGGVMQFLSTSALPVVCLCNGPDVPSDLNDASLDLFARLLMQTGKREGDGHASERSAEIPGEEGQYLANRNSDIFHQSGCKWIRLINKDNIVMFGSFAEALNNRFKPCRYCSPQHLSITGLLNQVQAVE